MAFSRLFWSIEVAACLKWFRIAVSEWPLASRCCAKFPIRVPKFLSVFCFQKRRKFPTIRPLKQLVGCAEIGGM